MEYMSPHEKIILNHPESVVQISKLRECLSLFLDTKSEKKIFLRSDIFSVTKPGTQQSKEYWILRTLVKNEMLKITNLPKKRGVSTQGMHFKYALNSFDKLTLFLQKDMNLAELIWPQGMYRVYTFLPPKAVNIPKPIVVPEFPPCIPLSLPASMSNKQQNLFAEDVVPKAVVPKIVAPQAIIPVKVEQQAIVPVIQESDPQKVSLAITKELNDNFVSNFGMTFPEFMGKVVKILHISGESQIYTRTKVESLEKEVTGLNAKMDGILFALGVEMTPAGLRTIKSEVKNENISEEKKIDPVPTPENS